MHLKLDATAVFRENLACDERISPSRKMSCEEIQINCPPSQHILGRMRSSPDCEAAASRQVRAGLCLHTSHITDRQEYTQNQIGAILTKIILPSLILRRKECLKSRNTYHAEFITPLPAVAKSRFYIALCSFQHVLFPHIIRRHESYLVIFISNL